MRFQNVGFELRLLYTVFIDRHRQTINILVLLDLVANVSVDPTHYRVEALFVLQELDELRMKLLGRIIAMPYGLYSCTS